MPSKTNDEILAEILSIINRIQISDPEYNILGDREKLKKFVQDVIVNIKRVIKDSEREEFDSLKNILN